MSKKTLQTAASQPEVGDPMELEICGVKTVFRYCPPGTFLMGSPEGEKGRSYYEAQREVSLTRGFWLQETPVTQRLWAAVVNAREFLLALKLRMGLGKIYSFFDAPSKFKGDASRPVENVNHDCAKVFAALLNATGFPPEGFCFDLPSGEEWEYACRAGTTTRYNVGDELTDLDANFGKNIGETTPVKSYPPNAWGFYDMHGNVKEWLRDFVEGISCSSTRNEYGSFSSNRFVVRGGGWNDDVWNCRSASWNARNEFVRSFAIGFRLALITVEPSRASFFSKIFRKLRF